MAITPDTHNRRTADMMKMNYIVWTAIILNYIIAATYNSEERYSW